MNDAVELDPRRDNAPTDYDIAAIVPGRVAFGASSSIVMQEHLPTMAELQERQAKVEDSVEYTRCVTKDKHWCFSVVLLLRQLGGGVEPICEHVKHKALIICRCKIHAFLLVQTLWHAAG